MPAHADLTEKTQQQVAFAPPPNDTLQPYTPSVDKPWNALRVMHLYRRLGFGATLEQIQQGLQLSPSALVDQLLDTAFDLDIPAPPYWAGYTSADYDDNQDLVEEHRRELRHRWLNDMLSESIRAKMALFWHNHFVTELNVYQCNSYMWSYYSMLHEYAFGNFRVFTREMGKNPAMLDYLNGNSNIVGNPNENYARELMELFTMGESNGYSQADIVEMARALTGWQAMAYLCTPAFYNADLHDNQSKTIFGQTSNFSFTTAHNLIFTARSQQVSAFITTKLYKNYVYQQPDALIIAGLAETFKTENWELMPVLKQLFKSEHFFEEKFINARLKNPLESMIPMLKNAGATPAEILPDWWDAIGYWSYQLGQELLNPPNVAGWKGHHTWINESTLTARWNFSSITAYLLTQDDQLRENLRNIALALTNESNDPAVIVPTLVAFFTGQTLEPVYQLGAIINFKAGIPENYFQDGSWNLYWDESPDQIVNLLYYLVKMPEYQLT